MSKADKFKNLAKDNNSNPGSMKRAFEAVTGLGETPPAAPVPTRAASSNKAVKKTTFRFSDGFHTRLKLYAVSKGRSMDDIVEEALEEYMKQNP